MPEANRYDDAIADELNKVGIDLKCERYVHETNDEYGYRLLADVEEDIDRLEGLLADLEKLRANIAALL